MSTTTWARLSRAGAVAAVGALAVALLPTVAAQAAVPPAPNFAYRSDVTALTSVGLRSNSAASSGTADELVPAGYEVFGYDASDSGRAWAGCMATGTTTTNSYDRSFALVLTHTDGTTTRSRSLSTFCEANPVVSRDGSTVWWFADDQLYKFVADYTDPSTIAGTTTVVSTGQFVRATDAAGDPIEKVLALAVSPDGTNASALFRNGSTNRVRSSAMSTAATKPGSVQVASSSAAAMPQASTFVYLDNDTLLYASVETPVSGPKVIHNVTLDTPAAATPAGTAVGDPVEAVGLVDLYDVRPHGSDFWAWKDAVDPVTTDWVSTTLFSVDPVGRTAVTAGTTRADGASTYSYIPVTNPPPALVPVQNKAKPHAYFATSASLVAYKKAVAYTSYNLYDVNQDGLASFDSLSAAETDRGQLKYYWDGMSTYATLRYTSGAAVFPIGSRWYNGYAMSSSKGLLKNTWLRWTFEGDYLTEAAAPITRLVKVAPAIAVRKAVSGRYTTVYGTATRAGGTSVLQRLTSRGWRTVTSAALVKKGSYLSTYTYGRRALPKGAYRVLTVADRGWALGASVAFRI